MKRRESSTVLRKCASAAAWELRRFFAIFFENLQK
jgi:hypothetical protein